MNLRPTQSNTSSRSRSPRGRFAMSTSLQVAALLAAGAAGSAHAQSSTLTFWGGNGSGQSTVPAGLGGSTAIAGGGLHSVALTSSGSVVCWGSNAFGQTAVPPGLGIVQAIAAGTNHTLVVRADGTVASWGQNTGIGGALAVPAGVTGAVAAAAGNVHSIILKSAGTVQAWGTNSNGQVTIPAGLSGVTKIAAGSLHNIALRNTGTVTCWGAGTANTGLNFNYGQSVPPAGLANVAAIAGGQFHSLAARADGTVATWGQNTGTGGPLAVPAGLSGVTAVAAGNAHSVALRSNGTVVAWGSNASGQTTIPANLGFASRIASGGTHVGAIIAPPPTAVLVSTSAANCNTATGAIDVTVTNTTSTAWTGPNGFTASTVDLSNVAAGLYTLTASGAGGSVQLQVTVATAADTIDPVVSSYTAALTGAAGQNCSAAVPNFAATVVASDNCTASGSLSVTQSPVAGTARPLGDHAVVITVRDASGNETQVNAVFTVTGHSTLCFHDADADSFGNPLVSGFFCIAPVGYVSNDGDCDDSDSTVHPGADEECDEEDDDCDSFVDEDLPTYSYYPDADGDGYGDGRTMITTCSPIAPPGYVANDLDCNDASAVVFPGAPETCANDGVDNDCDGIANEDSESTDAIAYFVDGDADGFGAGAATLSCSPIAGSVTNSDDCDDALVTFADGDTDGFGAGAMTACGVATDTDCNDADAAVNPNAVEDCANLAVDNDCDGSTADAEAIDATSYYADIDLDGFGAGDATKSCSPIAGSVTNNDDCQPTQVTYNDGDLDGFGAGAMTACGNAINATDCDDSRADINPSAVEDCANLAVDNDCDGTTSDAEAVDATSYYADIDQDGFGAGDATKSCTPIQGSVTNNADCQPTQVTYNDGDLDGFGAGTMTACGNTTNDADCNDGDASVNPKAIENCANLAVDNDCDGTTSDAEAVDATDYYADADGDGFGAGDAIPSCSKVAGAVTNNSDCAPDAVTYADNDGDGFGAGAAIACGAVTTAGDCNDGDAGINPSAAETCNGIDDDCDGQLDDGLVFSRYYLDQDQDTYGDPLIGVLSCQGSAPEGYVANSTDCNDADAGVNPGADERCADLATDNDCDGSTDEAEAIDRTTFYADDDADTYGDAAATTMACSAPAGFVAAKGDCNDNDAAVNPAATETCNTIDDNCNGSIDEGVQSTFYADGDGDGFGNALVTQLACSAPAGFVADSTDCDDTRAAVHALASFFIDADIDGFGSTGTAQLCEIAPPSGYSSVSTDCNDASAAINPGAQEICDAANTDEDCDGQADDLDASATGKTTFYRDADADGYTGSTSADFCDMPAGYEPTSEGDCNDNDAAVNPAATETCNTIDDNCNGSIDEGVQSTFYADADGDGFGNALVTQLACSAPAGFVADSTDCDDTRAAVHALASFFIDADIDGFGSTGTAQLCEIAPPSGYSSVSTDCDDANAAINPGAQEICDAANTDEDCDGQADDLDASATGKTTFYRDADADGYTGSTSADFCDMPAGYEPTSEGDCDDARATAYPGAPELCNTLDDDCDTVIDNDLTFVTYYRDADADGFGNNAVSEATCTGNAPAGFVAAGDDCDDASAAVYPGALENCANLAVDNDCDGDSSAGEAIDSVAYYTDADVDGYGASNATAVPSCTRVAGSVTNNGDCNDGDATAFPGGIERCANLGVDNDCDGSTAEDEAIDRTTYYRDLDGDGSGDPAGPTVVACEAPAGYVPDNNDGCPNDANKLEPGVCGCGVADTDSDGDGTPNCNDGCPNDANKLEPGTCGCGVPDTDSDGDSTPDCIDGCPADPAKTAPGACGCGVADTDSDGDGTPNCNDGCPNDPAKIAPGACGCGTADTDSDGDSTPDCNDGCPNDPAKTIPGACGCGVADTDSDGDNTPDCIDGCPADPLKIAPGTCGCGTADTDSDGDNTPDCNDGCPADPAKTAPGTCGCGVADTDSDGDGTPNCNDNCPNDPAKVEPGFCGCGTPDEDVNGNGQADCADFILGLVPSVNSVRNGAQFVVTVSSSWPIANPPAAVNGAQFAIDYDETKLAFLGVAPAAGSPLTVPFSAVHNPANGTLCYALGAEPGAPGMTEAAALGSITFVVLEGVSECNPIDLVKILPALPPVYTRLTTNLGEVRVPVITALPTVALDFDAPVLSGVPVSPVSIPVDAGLMNQGTYLEPTIASLDGCEGPLGVELEIVLPDSTVLGAWPTDALFPVGESTVTWSSTDSAGNVSSASIMVEVRNEQFLNATFTLSGAIRGNSVRPIRITFGSQSTVREVPFTQASGSVSDFVIAPQVPEIPCILAKDVTHSLSTATSATIVDREWSASFFLRQGDCNDDDVVDIYDFSIFAAARSVPGSVLRETNAIANFNADTLINNADFAILSSNFFEIGDTCGGVAAGREPAARVSVKELRRRGLGHLADADLNRDGWIDTRDVQLYLQGAGPAATAE